MAELTRFWDEFVDDLADALGITVYTMAALSVLVAGLVAVAWYFWPAWLPWRWNWSALRRRPGRGRAGRRSGGRRLGPLRWRLRWRRRRGKVAEEEPDEPLPDDVVPDLPAEVLALTADELAAAGRYAEAVRERLRSMLRGLIERGLLPASPGWTVMELAAAAAQARPALSGPCGGAAAVFSEIWYGLRPATADDDEAMRGFAAAAAQIAAEPVPTGVPG